MYCKSFMTHVVQEIYILRGFISSLKKIPRQSSNYATTASCYILSNSLVLGHPNVWGSTICVPDSAIK
jgi:hypothetical protein